ncbi:MAG: hypothetical protein EOO88_58310 [Pedobacter sp.]|nr:MAG: hypothetical protein EOO88_58310 [Pedobacter sp.]
MENWKLTAYELPEDGRFVIANIVDGNQIYAEYLAHNYASGIWYYRNGQELEAGKKVTGWQAGPGNLVNG